MKATSVACFVVSGAVVFTVAVGAHQGGTAGKPQEGQAAAKEHTMTGCLQKGSVADTFVVMSTAEKGPKTIGIVESKPNLAPHLGHKIDITGVGVPNKDAESATVKPPKADHYMKISAIKMVSATCP